MHLRTSTAAVPSTALLAGAAISIRPNTMLEAEPTASSKATATAALSARLLLATKPAGLTSCTAPAAAVATGGCCPSKLLEPQLKLFDLVTGALAGAVPDTVTDAVPGAWNLPEAFLLLLLLDCCASVPFLPVTIAAKVALSASPPEACLSKVAAGAGMRHCLQIDCTCMIMHQQLVSVQPDCHQVPPQHHCCCVACWWLGILVSCLGLLS